MTPSIGITLGDVTGIGPEVTLKALASGNCPAARYVVIGDRARIDATQRALGLKLEFQPYNGPQTEGHFFAYHPKSDPLPAELTAGSPAAALAALAALESAAKFCLRQELDAMVTAPVNKESILRTGKPFIGQTEFLSELAGSRRTAMMLLGSDDRARTLRVALVTTHLPLRLVPDCLAQPKIEQVIELAAEACQLLGLARARIGVCGLNPHAGEGGQVGTEEIKVIGPAVRAAQQRNVDVHGPFSADTLFYHAYRGDYDAVVAMYHDQGLVPLKMIGFDTGINWTLGLPFIRTSPDHGTAYDIAGKGIANSSSMQAAIRLAHDLAIRKCSAAR